MSDRYILDENNNPVIEPDLITWARWFEDVEKGTVKKTNINGVDISTVFLGLDHNYGEGLPVLWETMIFNYPDLDGYQERYYTYEEALAGHLAAEDLVLQKCRGAK